MVSAEAYIRVTLYILSRVYLGYIYVYIYACNNNEERTHEFEREQGGLHKGLGGRNEVNIILK